VRPGEANLYCILKPTGMESIMRKVFLVDDDRDIIEQNKMVLEAEGYEVVTASSAKEAGEILPTANPDIMVLDVMMEHNTAGLEFAKRVSSDTSLPNVPIVLLTSDANNPNWLAQDKFTWNSIIKILDKPTPPESLVETVEKLLNK
jgi:two-component system, NtrC family, response regulator GlrR